MPKYRAILILLTTFLLSCSDKSEFQVKFGCDPPCEKNTWLTFAYDSVYLLQDSTGGIKLAINNDTLVHYVHHHDAHRLTTEDIKTIDQALSCGMWTCEKTPTKKELYDPENVIIFVKSTQLVSYIAICSKSNIVECKPNSDNKEIAIFSSLIRSITRKD